MADEPPVAPLTDEEVRAHTDLAKEFGEMRFTETEAHLLAAALVDPDAARGLLGRGCSHRDAVRILI